MSLLGPILQACRAIYTWLERPRALSAAASGNVPSKEPIDIDIDRVFAMIVGRQSEPGVAGAASVIIGHLATAKTRFATEHMREWLLRGNVERDVKRAAKRGFLSPTAPPQPPEPETLAAYETITGEARHIGENDYRLVVDAIVHTLRANQSQDASASISATEYQAERILAALPPHTPAVISNPGSAKLAAKETRDRLSKLLRRRASVPESMNRAGIRDLVGSLEIGDLVSAPDDAKAEVYRWAARMHAYFDGELFDTYLGRARSLGPNLDLTTLVALRLAYSGNSDQAFRSLRDSQDPDHRSVAISILAFAKRQNDVLEWLGPLVLLQVDSLTGVGWRAVGVILAEKNRHEEASGHLSRATSRHIEECPDILYARALVSVALQYPVYTRVRILEGSIPFQIERREGVEPDRLHVEACRDLNASSTAFAELDLQERARHARCLALTLRLCRKSTETAARQEVTTELQDIRSFSFDLVPIALHFNVLFDHKAYAAALEKRERIGGLEGPGLEARIALLRQGDASTYFDYLETNRAHLSKALHPGFLVGEQVNSCVRMGRISQARQLLEGCTDDLGEDRERLSLMIEQNAGADPTAALEAQARRTGSPMDLANLCIGLWQAKNWTALIEPAERLFTMEPNSDNLRRLLASLQKSKAPPTRIADLLEQNEYLVAQYPEFVTAKTQAYMFSGRVVAAVDLARQRYEQSPSDVTARLLCDALLLSGQWDELATIGTAELARSAERSAAHLAQLALICDDGVASLALKLARAAAAKPEIDAASLLKCATVSLRLGADQEAFGWIAKAETLSGDSGPVRRVDHNQAIKVFRERLDANRAIESLLSTRQIPLHLAAESWGIGLSRLLLGNFHRNSSAKDARQRSVIPLYSGVPRANHLPEIKHPIIDLSSLLVLACLGKLPLLETAFERIDLPWSTSIALRQSVLEAHHHQRSMIDLGERLREMVSNAVLRRLPPMDRTGLSPLTDQVGEELADLISWAEAQGGRVVHTARVSKAGELDQRADLGPHASTFLSLAQFADLLRERGALEEDQHSDLSKHLKHLDEGPPLGGAYSSGPLFLSSLAVAYLIPLGVLDALERSNLVVYVSDESWGEAAQHAERKAEAERIVSLLNSVTRWYAAGLRSSRIRLAPRLNENSSESNDIELGTLREVLNASNVDGAMIDDRFLLSNAWIETTTAKLPLFGTHDLLSYLQSKKGLRERELWSLRHKLRLAGASCIPIDPQELLHHLRHLNQINTEETIELRTIRESLGVLNIRQSLVIPQEGAFLASIGASGFLSIRELWRDNTLDPKIAEVRASWIWNHVVPIPVSWWHKLPNATLSLPSPPEMRMALQFASTFLVYDGSRGSRARAWISSVFLAPWWTDNSFRESVTLALQEFVRGALEDVAEPMIRHELGRVLLVRFGNLVPGHIEHDVEFLRSIGMEKEWPPTRLGDKVIVALPRLQQLALDHLAGRRTTIQDVRREIEVAIETRGAEHFLRWVVDSQPHEMKMPVDLLFFSPDREGRQLAYDALSRDSGPTGLALKVPAQQLVDRIPDPSTVAVALSAVAASLPWKLSTLERELNAGRLNRLTVIPEDLAYWEAIVGSAPFDSAQSEWLEAVWRPRAVTLTQTFGLAGFRIVASSNVRPGLIDRSTALKPELLAELKAENLVDWGPFAVLAVAESARHWNIPPTGPIASDADVLGDIARHLQTAEGNPQVEFDVFSRLFRSVSTTLAASAIMSGQPSWWVRMCALVHADLLLGFVLNLGELKTEFLEKLESLEPAESDWAELLRLREEPLWRPELGLSEWLKAEVLGRLAAVLSEAGDEEAATDVIKASAAAGTQIGWPGAGFSPGPLECAMVSLSGLDSLENLGTVLSRASQDLEEASPSPSTWLIIDMFSRMVIFDVDMRRRIDNATKRWSPQSGSSDSFIPLVRAARVAASQRDTHLAESVIANLDRVELKDVRVTHACVQIALVAAAAWVNQEDSIDKFATATQRLAWRANASASRELAASLHCVSWNLSIAVRWRLATAVKIAELGAASRMVPETGLV
jgi:hypothetical protein